MRNPMLRRLPRRKPVEAPVTHVLERGLWAAQADETRTAQSYPQNPSNPHHPPAVNFPDRSAPFPVLP